jgi:transposase
MPPANRHEPTRAASSESDFSLMEFMREYPDDAACLEHLWRSRYSEDGEHADCPRCERERVFKRYETKQGRQSWTCTGCGHHVHPTAGTIFHGSSTSLHLWFFAMYLMASTRCGISAKELEREIGVSYRTAWRMLNKIRNQLMAQDAEPLSGEVELDETLVGGKPRKGEGVTHENARKWSLEKKVEVFGMVERGGRAKATVIPNRSSAQLDKAVGAHVLPSSMIFTDDWKPYGPVGRRFKKHSRIAHSSGVYVEGPVHTQSIEGLFGLIKNGIRGTYHSVSSDWLPSYLNEYVWRYNERDNARSMFRSLVENAAKP